MASGFMGKILMVDLSRNELKDEELGLEDVAQELWP